MALAYMCAFLWVASIHCGYVQRSGSQLQLDGQPFYFIGANAYWLIDQSTVQYKVDNLMTGAQALGLTVIRTWAFNSLLPHDDGNHGLAYDEAQFRILDYVVQAAKYNKIRLVLSLGNFWPDYIGPEDYLHIATGSADGKTVADFYSDMSTRALYASHIGTITSRVNSLSNIAYRDDETIMMWDLMNEPRCPGCSPAQMQDMQSWLSEMSDLARGAAPSQLISASTEGYFMYNNVQSNPGCGSSCMGDDFPSVTGLAGVDVATAHMYYRETEGVPGAEGAPWTPFTYDRYLQWFSMYLGLHLNTGKPLIIEEFNLQVGVQSEQQRNALFQWLADQLVASKRAGGPIAGIMYWEAAVSGIEDFGYNIYMQRRQRALSSHHHGLPTPMPTPMGHRRQLADVHIGKPPEQLDAFRMYAQQLACEQALAPSWQPMEPPIVVDVTAYLDGVAGKNVLDIIRNTAQDVR